MLVQSFEGAGLSNFTDRIVEMSRPCLRFLRIQQPDDEGRALKSRIGGFPALPPGFQWPMRPAFSDAATKAAQLDHIHQTTVEMMGREVWQQTVEQVRAYLSPNELSAMKYPYSSDGIEEIKQAHIVSRESLFKAMPLTFVAQLNLEDLSSHIGFDRSLPSTGMLFFFEDITAFDQPGQVLYINCNLHKLEQHPFPAELIQFVKSQKNGREEIDQAAYCEVLQPYSAISIPCHWRREAYGALLQDWLTNQPRGLNLPSSGETEGDFGDQLAGWPGDIQDHPEFDMDPHQKPKLFEPAQTPWRMIFSYGAEFFYGSRAMTTGGDGQTYWMIHEG